MRKCQGIYENASDCDRLLAILFAAYPLQQQKLQVILPRL